MKICENFGTVEQEKKLNDVLKGYSNKPNELMSALQKSQEIYGYLPKPVIIKIAETLDVPVSEVYGVVTFYTQFNLEPKAKYNINICMGTACFVQGSENLLKKVEDKLNLKLGKISSDGKWLITTCRCLGCCGLAPVITINDKVYGKVTVEQLDEIIDNIK